MRRLWIRRKAVSSMIGGIIILAVFLTALVAMMVLSQQYDTYQSTAEAMQQKQIDMYSENLLAVFPGITNGTGTSVGNTWQVDCIGSTGSCNNYTLTLNNLGITTQIVRIYISSTIAGCTPCVLDSATNPLESRFRASDSYVNPGEFTHNVVLWLPSSVSLSGCTNNSECKVTTVTARGRVFSFIWPFPTVGAVVSSGQGGTGIYIGPLVITFQKELITYTSGDTPIHPNTQTAIPPIPIGGDNGRWVLTPTMNNTSLKQKIIIYIKIQTDKNVTTPVYLTPQSVLELARFDNPGQGLEHGNFFLIAPITPTFCNEFVKPPYNSDLDCGLDTYQTIGNTGILTSIASYQSCGKPPDEYASCSGRYVIPPPTQPGERGPPVIVAFAVTAPSGTTLQKMNYPSGMAVTSFLGLSYVYENATGAGPYLYGVTLPFIAACIGGGSSTCTTY